MNQRIFIEFFCLLVFFSFLPPSLFLALSQPSSALSLLLGSSYTLSSLSLNKYLSISLYVSYSSLSDCCQLTVGFVDFVVVFFLVFLVVCLQNVGLSFRCLLVCFVVVCWHLIVSKAIRKVKINYNSSFLLCSHTNLVLLKVLMSFFSIIFFLFAMVLLFI